MPDIIPVTDRKTRAAFIRLPHLLYNEDPHWTAPLDMERAQHFSAKNPYFKHADVQMFVALEEKKPVGRISAHIDTSAQKEGDKKTGHFGFLEARDEEVLHRLLQTAEAWLLSKGCSVAAGPYSFSINDEAGLLVEGFDSRPRFLMNHAPHWYASSLESAGYTKAKDLIAYTFRTDAEMTRQFMQQVKKAEAQENLSTYPVSKNHLAQGMRVVIDVFNEAWKNNWGFIPMTEDEVAYAVHNMKPVLKEQMVRIAELDNKPVAVVAALPDSNELLHGLGGRLFPFGWVRLLWRMKVKKQTSARLFIMGVLPEIQKKPAGIRIMVLLFHQLCEEARKQGIKDIEFSWVLEDNTPIINMILYLGATPYKRYRLYEKALV